MNTVDAAYATAHDYAGGTESLAPRLGMSPAILRGKVNPNDCKHHLTLADANKMMAFTGDHRILRAQAHEHGYLLVKAPESTTIESDMTVLEHVAAMAVANGEFMRSIYQALSDGKLTDREMGQIQAAGLKAMTELAEVTQRLHGMAD